LTQKTRPSAHSFSPDRYDESFGRSFASCCCRTGGGGSSRIVSKCRSRSGRRDRNRKTISEGLKPKSMKSTASAKQNASNAVNAASVPLPSLSAVENAKAAGGL